MSLTKMNGILSNSIIQDHPLITKMDPLISACERSKDLMVGIYLLDTRRFLCCNFKFKELLGHPGPQLLEQGWEFWNSLVAPADRLRVKKAITDFTSFPYVQSAQTIRYHMTNLLGRRVLVRHELRIHQVDRRHVAVNYVFDLSETEKIEHCFENFAKPLSKCLPQCPSLVISPREKQVLQLISDGFSSKEIADMLFISNHTAVSHRKNLIEKFQVRNTAHLVKRALSLLKE